MELETKIKDLQAANQIAEKQKICFEIIDSLLSDLTDCKPKVSPNEGYSRVNVGNYWYLNERWHESPKNSVESIAEVCDAVGDCLEPFIYGSKKADAIAVYCGQDEIPMFTIPFAINAMKVYVPDLDNFGKFYDLQEFCKSAKDILKPRT